MSAGLTSGFSWMTTSFYYIHFRARTNEKDAMGGHFHNQRCPFRSGIKHLWLGWSVVCFIFRLDYEIESTA